MSLRTSTAGGCAIFSVGLQRGESTDCVIDDECYGRVDMEVDNCDSEGLFVDILNNGNRVNTRLLRG